MDVITAIILGVIQGLTEFLPVSSSGHLEIAKTILGEGWVGKESLLMTVVLHFATALSTIIIFRKDICFKRPGTGISPMNFKDVIGKDYGVFCLSDNRREAITPDLENQWANFVQKVNRNLV